MSNHKRRRPSRTRRSSSGSTSRTRSDRAHSLAVIEEHQRVRLECLALRYAKSNRIIRAVMEGDHYHTTSTLANHWDNWELRYMVQFNVPEPCYEASTLCRRGHAQRP